MTGEAALRLYVYGLTGVVVLWALVIAGAVARATWRRLRSRRPPDASRAVPAPLQPSPAGRRDRARVNA